MNTKVHYLYRDADNYKQWNEAVLAGEFKEEDIKFIESVMDYEYFIPEQVGLHLTRPDDSITEADHCYAELDTENGFELTDENPNEDGDLSWEEFVENFRKVKETGWDDVTYGVSHLDE